MFFVGGGGIPYVNVRGKKGTLTLPHLIVEVTAGQTQYHDYVTNLLLHQIKQYKWNKSQTRFAAVNLIKEQGVPLPQSNLPKVICHPSCKPFHV